MSRWIEKMDSTHTDRNVRLSIEKGFDTGSVNRCTFSKNKLASFFYAMLALFVIHPLHSLAMFHIKLGAHVGNI